MKILAHYVMKGQTQAISLSTLFAMLSLIIAPLSYISGAIVALVTLRNGGQAGLVVWGLSALFMAIMAWMTMGNIVIAGLYALAVWIPLWLVAMQLRKTISLPLSLSLVTLISALVVLAIHVMLGDPVTQWAGMLNTMFSDMFAEAATPEMGAEEMIAMASQVITGILGAAFVMGMMFSLSLARWWQSLLYNPGGFGVEFRALKLDKTSTVIATLILVWAVFGAGLGSLASDLAFVVVSAFSVPGIALFHDVLERTKASIAWAFVLYGLLLFIAPHLLVLLTLIAVIDAWVDLRRFIKTKDTPVPPSE